jgi:ATP-dependent RNA helicase DHX37/DHR1
MFSDVSKFPFPTPPTFAFYFFLICCLFLIILQSEFPFPTPPNKESLVEAEHSLKALKALDNQSKITPLGEAMAQYPMSPRHSCLLLAIIKILKSRQGFARPNFILGYAAAASALSSPNPFLMQNQFSGEPKEHNPDSDDEDQQERKRGRSKLKAMVRDSHAKFINPSSDALTIAHALRLFELSENTVEFCRMNSLHLKTMEEMSKLRKQLL